MKRGEIYFAHLDPSLGGETKKIESRLRISNSDSIGIAKHDIMKKINEALKLHLDIK